MPKQFHIHVHRVSLLERHVVHKPMLRVNLRCHKLYKIFEITVPGQSDFVTGQLICVK